MWTPRKLANLSLWFAADYISGLADGAAVAQWDDLSGNGRHATQATAGKRPIYRTNVLNGRPVLRFASASAQRLFSTFSSIAQPMTLFIVWNSTSTNSIPYQRVFCGETTGRPELGWYNNQIYFTASNTISYGKTLPFSHIINTIVINGGSSAIFENAVSRVTGNSGTLSLINASIGASYSDTTHLQGDIAEIILYSTNLSVADQSTVHTYLGAKYGISV